MDTKLAGMEVVLDRLTRTVEVSRARLAPTRVEPTEDVAASGEEDGFFDQDQT